MTEKQESKAKEIAARHLLMSNETLKAIRDAGLASDRSVQLDFYFNAPNEKSAQKLVKNLEANDCLNLMVEKSGSIFSRKFRVHGKTHPTEVTEQILEAWIPWIVVQGAACECEFDGWGIEV
ncbi:MAG: ribonuclease E inhibitor RraB [Deltaproteobacteria bacterium]|jgi:hypothetical protein|nr:ribonuclease E inhibitor RraB [Deltaproteobacteria bacterium]